MIPVEVTQTPWRYTTFPEALDHWQSLVAGLLAFVAAVIVVVGSEWRARKALRASLASEVRLYVDHLIKLREMLTRLEPSFVDEGAARRQYDLRDLTALYPPTVYPAAAAGTMGLLSRPSAADVVDFYATVERLKTTARLMSNEPNENAALELFDPHRANRSNLSDQSAATFQVSSRRARRRIQSGDREMERG